MSGLLRGLAGLAFLGRLIEQVQGLQWTAEGVPWIDAVDRRSSRPVDWSELTEEAIFASVATAPKVAGRWSKVFAGRFVRRDPWGDVVATVSRTPKGWKWTVWGFRLSSTTLSNAREAIDAADEDLRRRRVVLLPGGDEPEEVVG